MFVLLIYEKRQRERERENRCLRFVSDLKKEKKSFGIHFIISFQYFINILVITVKAGWVFVSIYEGTFRRCVVEYLVVLPFLLLLFFFFF